MKPFRECPFAILLAASLIAAWVYCAFALDQSLFAVQRSRALLQLGAINGELLHSSWWRLLTSQFIHVHLPHMLFNALGILAVASGIERRYGWCRVALIFLIGGTVGQLASVLAYAILVSSGASQALLSLCGAAFVLGAGRAAKLAALCVVIVQVILDVNAADGIKAGHGFGFAAGVLLGFASKALTADSEVFRSSPPPPR